VFDATTEAVLPKQFKIVLTTYLQNVKIFAGRKMKNKDTRKKTNHYKLEV